MGIFRLIIIALGLSVDTFAVSVTSGISIKKCRVKRIIRLAAIFCIMQALMPFLGWVAGNRVRYLLESYGHFFAFIILVFIGGKMIYESIYSKKKMNECPELGLFVVLILAVVTSIDAFAVGFSFSLLGFDIVLPVIIIGLVTFVLAVTGLVLGEKIGLIVGSRLEIVGGIALIILGLKILIEGV